MNTTIPVHKQVMIPIGKLRMADYNPRTIAPSAMLALKRQIVKNGLVQPLVARDEDGLLIGGHQRLHALKAILEESKLSEQEIAKHAVPTIMLHGITDAEAKSLNLALNKISGDWDYAKLGEVLAELESINGDDHLIELAGFSDTEVADILGIVSGDDALGTSEDLDEDVEIGLAAEARKFRFNVQTDEDAAFATSTLRKFGMTGPGNAANAFMAALRAAGGDRE